MMDGELYGGFAWEALEGGASQGKTFGADIVGDLLAAVAEKGAEVARLREAHGEDELNGGERFSSFTWAALKRATEMGYESGSHVMSALLASIAKKDVELVRLRAALGQEVAE